MSAVFRKAKKSEAASFFALIEARVIWMKAQGIQQWSEEYLHLFPLSYYQENIDRLYILTEVNRILCGGVLLEEDSRWNEEGSALYIHNLASDSSFPRAGALFIEETENLARQMGKEYLRLDSIEGNSALEKYYEGLGFVSCGSCREGSYKGVLRQKKIRCNH